MVSLSRFELLTLRLSGVRSNQLSYKLQKVYNKIGSHNDKKTISKDIIRLLKNKHLLIYILGNNGIEPPTFSL